MEKFLLSMPSLQGSIFTESVILLADENISTPENKDSEEDFGVIINQKTNLEVSKLLQLLKIEFTPQMNVPVLIGGPVNLDFIWVLHDKYCADKYSINISKNIYLSPIMDFCLKHNQLKEKKTEFYHIGIGFSAWGKNQLNQEIEADSWWKLEMPISQILSYSLEDRWKMGMRHLGVNVQTLQDSSSFMGEKPQIN